nr:MAG TPA: hypothetical protein [Caudoviricetes sp.]
MYVKHSKPFINKVKIFLYFFQCQHLMTSLVMTPYTRGGAPPYQRLTLVNISRSMFYRP